MTDGRTDRQTELRWLRRAESRAAFARKKQRRWPIAIGPVATIQGGPKKRVPSFILG